MSDYMIFFNVADNFMNVLKVIENKANYHDEFEERWENTGTLKESESIVVDLLSKMYST